MDYPVQRYITFYPTIAALFASNRPAVYKAEWHQR